MPARPLSRGRRGPFLVPARIVLLAGGLLAIGLGLFNIYHELHATLVDGVYAIVAVVVAIIWVVALITAFLGWRPGIFLAGLLAFVEFGVVASAQFVAGAAAIDSLVKKEGLAVAAVDMAIIPSCALVIMAAAVSWTNARGRNRRLEMAPLLLTAVAGAILVILYSTNAFQRQDFGSANAEDASFGAAVLATTWLAGGLWISSARRIGALLIAVASFGVWYSFVTLHLVRGGTTLAQIAQKSGAGWAAVGVGATILAAASFVLALAVLVLAFVRRQPASATGAQPVRRRA